MTPESFEFKFWSMKRLRITYEFDGDLGGEGKDVGAGDDAGTRVFQRGLDVVHHGKAARRVVVGDCVLLGLDRREVVVEQERAVVSALDEAVVEVEADEAGRVARVGDARVLDDAPDDVVGGGARRVVERRAQRHAAGASAGSSQGEQEEGAVRGCQQLKRSRARGSGRHGWVLAGL
jgi:hypothetical protein